MARSSTKVIKAIRYTAKWLGGALAGRLLLPSNARPGVRPYAKYTSL